MRPPPKGPDPYGRGRFGQQQPNRRGPTPGQTTSEEKKQPPSTAQQAGNIRADVVWALRNAGGGMSLFDISSKLFASGKPRYPETKIAHVLELMIADGKVSKSDQTGRVTYKWVVEPF
jgi:hypothetical protein